MKEYNNLSLNRRRILQLTAGTGTLALGSAFATTPVAAAPGDLVWQYETGDAVSSSPTIIDETVFIGSNDNNVYALNAESGEEQWTFETGSAVQSSPTVSNNTVYVGSFDTNVYALNAETGEEQWTFETESSVISSPTVSNNTVYVGADESVYALNPETGEEQWTFETGDAVFSSPTVSNNTVYVGSDDANVYALNAETGEEQWTFEIGGLEFVRSSPTVFNNTVYVGADESVYALNAETGEEQWTFETGEDISSSPTVSNNTVYIGSFDNNVYALNAETGEEQPGWPFETGSAVFSSPTVSDGTVFIGSDDGNVYALEAGVEGSSEDTRVLLRGLGGTENTIGDPSEDTIDDSPVVNTSTLTIDPFPVETGDEPELSVEIINAEEAEVRIELRGGESFDPIDLEEDTEENNLWSTTESLPPIDDEGERIDLIIFPENESGSTIADVYDNRFITEENSRIGYYTVNETINTAVVYGKFEGPDSDNEGIPIDDSSIFSSDEEFEDWKQATELNVNNYYGSPNGSMGAVGFSLDHLDNDSEFYEVEPRSLYENINVPIFDLNLRQRAFLTSLQATLEDTEDSIILNNYDLWVGTHFGEQIDSAVAFVKDENVDNKRIYNKTEDPSVEPEEGEISSVQGTWYHEFGHALGLNDLYDIGNAGDLSIMGNANAYITRAPINTASRAGLNNIDDDELRAVDWLQISEINQNNIDAETGQYVFVPPLQGYQVSDEVDVINITNDIQDVDFIIEFRPSYRFEIDNTSDLFTSSETILIYRIEENGQAIDVHTDRAEDLLVSIGDSATLTGRGIDPVLIEFSLPMEEEVDEDDDSEFVVNDSGFVVTDSGEAVVNVSPTTFRDEVRLGIDASITLSDGLDNVFTEDPGITVPSLDLTATDNQGRIVGKDPETEEYVREIPGAQTSGNRINGLQWISVPEELDVEFTVSSDDVQQFINELEERNEGIETEDIAEGIDIEYQSSQIDYGEEAELIQEDGRYTVTDTQVRARVEQIEPGEEKNAVPRNEDSDIDIAEIVVDVNKVDDERITFVNTDESTLNLTDWTLSNSNGDTFNFPSFSLDSDDEVTIWTGTGEDTERNLYWGRNQTAWDPDGDQITLQTDEGDTALDVMYDSRGTIRYDPRDDSTDRVSGDLSIQTTSTTDEKLKVKEKNTLSITVKNGRESTAEDVELSLCPSEYIHIEDETISIGHLEPSESVTKETVFKSSEACDSTIEVKLMAAGTTVDRTTISFEVTSKEH